MPRIKGEDMVPMVAMSYTDQFQRIVDINRSIGDLCNERDELFEELLQLQNIDRPLTVPITDEAGTMTWTTFLVGKPKGHFVFYKEWDFVYKERTTKQDRELLGLTD